MNVTFLREKGCTAHVQSIAFPFGTSGRTGKTNTSSVVATSPWQSPSQLPSQLPYTYSSTCFSRMLDYDYRSCVLPSAATHIRLLKLQVEKSSPSVPDEPSAEPEAKLICEILITSIDAPRPYKALSYTWGTADKTSSLNISGTQLRITPSLYTALQHFAKDQGTLYLWVDQICIDQSNDAEKSAQVLLMTKVYSKAEQTLVWLGPAADRSDELLDLWLYVGEKAEAMGLSDYMTRDKIHRLLKIMESRSVDDPLTEPYHQLADESRPRFEELLQAIVDLDKRPWFHRVWVVQEVSLCLNTVFVCGHKIVPMEYTRLANNVFSTALKRSTKSSVAKPDLQFLRLVAQAQSSRIVPLQSTRHRRQGFQRGLGKGDELFNLLRKLFVESDTRATQTRDRIYGLLGLAVDAEQLKITPDYTTTDVARIFTDVARSMIEKGRVEILSYSQFPKEEGLEGLPTWVPDWRPNLAASFYTIFEYAENHLLNASGNTSVSLVPTTDANVLGIKGYLIDAIEEVGAVWHDSDQAEKLVLSNTIREFCNKSAAKNEPIYLEPGRRAEAEWRVPVGDLYWTPEEDYIRARKPLVEDAYRESLRVVEAIAAGTPRLTAADLQNMNSAKYHVSMSCMDGKRPYITHRGYLGMGPAAMCAGDVVVVLCGARLPYVLRSLSGTEMYAFLGEAYCDGMMDGEVVDREPERIFFIE